MSQTSVGVDFTLETVQYKFATIIGELCGKPSILSQFAVWLDLRLAEYKLKGSISLDCSGQKPSPEWLHGLKDPVNPSYGESLPGSLSRHESDQSIAQPGKTKPLSRQNDRHSTSTDVVVKTEPRDSVRHDGSRLFGENSHVSRSDRKRHNDSLSYEKLDVFSPSKSRRISATSPRSSIDNSGLSNYFPSQEQTVIGPNMDDLTTNDFDLMNRGSESSYDRGDNSTDMSYQRGDNSDFYSGTGLGDDSMSSESAPLKSFQQQSDAAGKSHVSGYQLVKAEENVRSGSNVTSSSADSIETRQFRRDSNRRGNSRGKVETLKNTFSAVKVIQSWLASAPYHVDLPVEAIRPEDLDRYLAHFFSVVKNRLGGDYHPLSFNALRSCIERYLQHHGYPCSIVKSDIFVSSRLSFKKRMAELQKLHPRRRTSTRNMRPNTSTDLVASLMSQDSPQNADNFSESFSQEMTDPAGFPISSQQIVKTEKCMDTTM